ncbi:Type IV pilus assembly PilZ [Candidatus Sulfopaludibacter sp. SbA3]|nr:Type IV pilus assembly PilZ [Candidatus Sulfopaludibacter sp. SbA3]
MACEEQTNETQSIAGDRRHDRRYDIHLELRWKLIRRKRVLDTGTGRTLDLSSGGILFETDRQLPQGLNVELSLAWPVMLHNVAPLQLVIAGRIVRSAGQRTAIQMVQHEFRTAPSENHNIRPISPRTPINLLTNAQLQFGKAH